MYDEHDQYVVSDVLGNNATFKSAQVVSLQLLGIGMIILKNNNMIAGLTTAARGQRLQ
ncbi:MAG: hypothetical protein ACLR56_11400 [Oscillospiraceae bacterium]